MRCWGFESGGLLRETQLGEGVKEDERFNERENKRKETESVYMAGRERGRENRREREES